MTLPEVPDRYDFRGQANTRPITPEEKEQLRNLHEYEEGAIEKGYQIVGTKEEKSRLGPVSKHIDNLIEHHDLPIVFSLRALTAAGVFAKNREEGIVLLLDCLTTFERETVTVDKLMRLYLFGFYNEELVKKILVGTVYTRKHPWHFIYPQ